MEYPPFAQHSDTNWQAFVSGYGPVPERRRRLLCALLQLLCAAMGVYMEPAAKGNDAWAAWALA